jgi:hypothetical protein
MGNSNAKEAELPTPDTPSDDKEEVQEVSPVGALPGAIILDANLQLLKVYGDHIHQNDGMHLDGGIKDNGAWQEQWHKQITLPSQCYDAPSGAVGRRFVNILALELEGIRRRKWNSECFIVFQMVVLQRSRDVKTTLAIRQRITKRLDSWEAKKFDMLVQDTEWSALAQLAQICGVETSEHRAKTLKRLVLQGKLRTAVGWVTK